MSPRIAIPKGWRRLRKGEALRADDNYLYWPTKYSGSYIPIRRARKKQRSKKL